jgi:translation initiation factor 2 alpha subunit (eIF-2alpha)
MSGATFQDLNYSLDRYSDTESFIAIQGINSEAYRNISTILKKIRILK